MNRCGIEMHLYSKLILSSIFFFSPPRLDSNNICRSSDQSQIRDSDVGLQTVSEHTHVLQLMSIRFHKARRLLIYFWFLIILFQITTKCACVLSEFQDPPFRHQARATEDEKKKKNHVTIPWNDGNTHANTVKDLIQLKVQKEKKKKKKTKN